MCDEPDFDGFRRGGGGIGLFSETGLLGSVIGGVSTAGEGCAAGGLCALREGGGGGTAFVVGMGVSSSSCMEFWVRFEPLRLRFCPWACRRDVGGGGGGAFLGRGASGCGTEGCVAGWSFAMVGVGVSGAA